MAHLMQTMQLRSECLRSGKASAVKGACSMDEQMMDENTLKRFFSDTIDLEDCSNKTSDYFPPVCVLGQWGHCWGITSISLLCFASN